MKQLLLISFLFVISNLFGQLTNRAQVKEYYQKINYAELAIVDSNFKEASDFYNQAFVLKQPNPRDFFNAFVVSYILNDSNRCKKYINELYKMGFKKQTIEWMPFVEKIKFENVYKNYISTDSFLVNSYLNSEKYTFSQQFDSIFLEDQNYRNNEHLYNFNVDSSNVEFIKTFSQKNSYPSVLTIGPTNNWGVRLDSPGAPYLIFWHTRGVNTSLDTLILDALLDGIFDPGDFAFQQDIKNLDYFQFLITDSFENLSEERKKIINNNRDAINLESLEEYVKKHNFLLKNPDFVFYNQLQRAFLQKQ